MAHWRPVRGALCAFFIVVTVLTFNSGLVQGADDDLCLHCRSTISKILSAFEIRLGKACMKMHGSSNELMYRPCQNDAKEIMQHYNLTRAMACDSAGLCAQKDPERMSKHFGDYLAARSDCNLCQSMVELFKRYMTKDEETFRMPRCKTDTKCLQRYRSVIRLARKYFEATFEGNNRSICFPNDICNVKSPSRSEVAVDTKQKQMVVSRSTATSYFGRNKRASLNDEDDDVDADDVDDDYDEKKKTKKTSKTNKQTGKESGSRSALDGHADVDGDDNANDDGVSRMIELSAKSEADFKEIWNKYKPLATSGKVTVRIDDENDPSNSDTKIVDQSSDEDKKQIESIASTAVNVLTSVDAAKRKLYVELLDKKGMVTETKSSRYVVHLWSQEKVDKWRKSFTKVTEDFNEAKRTQMRNIVSGEQSIVYKKDISTIKEYKNISDVKGYLIVLKVTKGKRSDAISVQELNKLISKLMPTKSGPTTLTTKTPVASPKSAIPKATTAPNAKITKYEHEEKKGSGVSSSGASTSTSKNSSTLITKTTKSTTKAPTTNLPIVVKSSVKPTIKGTTVSPTAKNGPVKPTKKSTSSTKAPLKPTSKPPTIQNSPIVVTTTKKPNTTTADPKTGPTPKGSTKKPKRTTVPDEEITIYEHNEKHNSDGSSSSSSSSQTSTSSNSSTFTRKTFRSTTTGPTTKLPTIIKSSVKPTIKVTTVSPTIKDAPVKPTKNSKPTIDPTTKSPTKVTTKAPNKAPTKTTTKAPTKTTTKAPAKLTTKAPNKAPTKTTTKAPTKTTTKAPTKPTTKAPIKATTKAPTKTTTKAPAKPPTTKNSSIVVTTTKRPNITTANLKMSPTPMGSTKKPKTTVPSQTVTKHKHEKKQSSSGSSSSASSSGSSTSTNSSTSIKKTHKPTTNTPTTRLPANTKASVKPTINVSPTAKSSPAVSTKRPHPTKATTNKPSTKAPTTKPSTKASATKPSTKASTTKTPITSAVTTKAATAKPATASSKSNPEPYVLLPKGTYFLSNPVKISLLTGEPILDQINSLAQQ